MNQNHRSVCIQCLHHEQFCEPQFLAKMILMSNKFCVTDTESLGTGKNTDKCMIPFAGHISHGCKPVCQQTLTQTFSPTTGEEFRRKGADSKARVNRI
jgi:hypothetical protein